MKTSKIFQFFSIAICVCFFFSSNMVHAQVVAKKVKIDCDKICYEYGITGTSFCIGGKGAVPPNSKVTVSDGKGNSVSGESKADGSFAISPIHQLVAPVGATVVVTVNGQNCKIIVRRPNSCVSSKIGRGGRGRNVGRTSRRPLRGVGGNQGQTEKEKSKDEYEEEKKELENAKEKIDIDYTEKTDLENREEEEGPDCDEICYEYGITGTSFCKGGEGAVSANSKVTLTDSKGNTVSGESRADGSFAIAPIHQLVAPVGSTVTVTVNGKSCEVIVKRPGGC